MTCAECEHPFGWHGDRAIGGCDGGWDRTDAGGMRRLRVAGEGVALCNCRGWTRG